jgi:enterochelin esterase-like enzyme
MKLRTSCSLALSLALLLAANTLLTPPASAQDDAPLTPRELYAALLRKPAGAEAERLVERLRAYFGQDAQGNDNLKAGKTVRTDDLAAAWAVELAEASAAPVVKADGESFTLPLARVGETNVYAASAMLPSGTAFRWHYEVGDRRFGGGQLEVYATHRDSLPQPGVPQGRLTQQPKWQSKIFAGTTRDWWIYVPAQYRAAQPACVMVFQDGQSAKNYVPVVFDNLIAKGDMPVTVGIFISPGEFADGRRNRSFEYDTLSDQYARFLIEEILPEVEKTVKLKKDAASRAVAGISSGGICAFTVAWQRPNEFSKVLSWIGSFTNIASGPTLQAGGHNYPALIRKTPPKPIRVFLQDGENDLDNIHGNWPLANHAMAKALEFKGYDYQFVMGKGFHSDRHGRAVLPDSLRWLWRDYGKGN